MAKKRLTLRDKQGNVIDYDISAARVTIDAEGKSLEVKLSELVNAIADAVKSISFNGNTQQEDAAGNVAIEQVQADWNQVVQSHPSFIKGKPDVVTGIKVGASGSTITPTNGVVTIPESGGSVDVDNAMSASSDNPVANRVIKAYVDNLINGIINGAPAALDTLNELSAALGNDSNFAATITQQLALKANDANVVKSISVNGQNQQTPNNGNVNLVVPSMSDVQDAIDEAVNDVVVGQVDAAVIDNFKSTSGTDALSAGKGKELNDRLDDVDPFWNEANANLLVTVLQNMVFDDASAGQAAATQLITKLTTAKQVVSIAATYTGSTYAGVTPTTSDFTVVATYGNGKTETLASGYTISPSTALVSGSNTITVTYGTVTTTVTITATANAITAITGVTMVQGATAMVGADSGDLDVADFISAVAVTYANGDTGTIYDLNEISFVSGTTIANGSNTVAIRINSYPTVTYNVTIVGGVHDTATVTYDCPNPNGTTYASTTTTGSITIPTPLDVVPNKVTISREATSGVTQANQTGIVSGTIEFEDDSTTDDDFDTVTSYNVYIDTTLRTDGKLKIIFTKDSNGKVTAANIKLIQYSYTNGGTTSYTASKFVGGYTYTFVFEHVSS